MFPISDTSLPAEFFDSFSDLDESQAIIIIQQEFGKVEVGSDGLLDLRRPPLESEGQFLIGYQNKFGIAHEIPDGFDNPEFREFEEGLVLVLFHAFCGIFKQGEVIDLDKEISSGERVIALEELALVVVEQLFTFVGVKLVEEEDPARTIARLQERIRRLEAALENCDPEKLEALIAENAQLNKIVNAQKAQISVLKNQVAERDNDILALKAQIQELLNKTKRSSEDFATAISHSVDHLQSKLSSMPNSVSDFVVREFDLEAKVYIDVNEEGKIDYRFVRPGDNAHPLNVSNLSLKLVPVPKQNGGAETPAEPAEPPAPAGALTASASAAAAPIVPVALPGANVPVERISGDAFQHQLNQRNIRTAADLLQVASRARTMVELSAMLGIDRQRLGQWVVLAQLMMIDGLRVETARLLADLGITSLRILAGMEPEGLLAQYNGAAAARGLPAASLQEVQRWTATAILFTGGVPGAGEE